MRTLLDGVDYELIDFHFQECVHVDICVRICQNRKRDSKKRDSMITCKAGIYSANLL